jgi:hypothetical protein
MRHCRQLPLPPALRPVLLMLAGLLPGLVPAQQVYRCPGADGGTVFQQAPCAGGQGQRVEVPPANVVESPPVHGELQRSLEARRAIGRGALIAGMTADEVRQVMGQPQAVNRSAGTWGTHDQLVYRHADGSTHHVYLRDGLVDSVSSYSGMPRRGQEPCYTEQEIRNAMVGTQSNVLPPEERQRRRLAAERMARCRR